MYLTEIFSKHKKCNYCKNDATKVIAIGKRMIVPVCDKHVEKAENAKKELNSINK